MHLPFALMAHDAINLGTEELRSRSKQIIFVPNPWAAALCYQRFKDWWQCRKQPLSSENWMTLHASWSSIPTLQQSRTCIQLCRSMPCTSPEGISYQEWVFSISRRKAQSADWLLPKYSGVSVQESYRLSSPWGHRKSHPRPPALKQLSNTAERLSLVVYMSPRTYRCFGSESSN